MRSAVGESTLWVPTNEEEKEMVRRQMNRLLETTHFRNSRRYPPLFRFIVEETLEGRGEFLKERLLGIHVFGRPADYDTATDPIVRVTIAEIRKRIAQYYHEEAHESEMRIELLPGRYEPEFRPRREHEPPPPASPQPVHELEPHLAEPLGSEEPTSRPLPSITVRAASRKRRVALIVSTVAVVLLILAGIPFWQWLHPSALEDFWGPLLAGHHPIFFCLPNGAGKTRVFSLLPTPPNNVLTRSAIAPAPAAHTPTFLDHESLGENVVFSDALATLKISNLMAAHDRETRFRLNVATTLDDLRQGPSVLVGGLDNNWTLRTINPLRFHFAGSDQEAYWIQDSKDPGNKQWGLDLKTQYASVNRDYAIVARIHDDATGQWEVVVAGIGMSGTAAAGEFLTDAHQLEELRRRVGPGFRDRDFEAVISTDVVNGISGSPRILTVATW